MKIGFEGGAIVHYDDFCSRSYYDVSNNLLTAQFDGMGGISKYAVINKWDFFECYYNQMAINDKVFDLYAPKKVTMVGRKMVIETETPEAFIRIEQFTDDTTNAILEEFFITAKDVDVKFENVVNFGVNKASYIKNFFDSRMSAKTMARLFYGSLSAKLYGHKRNEERDDCLIIRNRMVENWYLDFAVSKPAFARETSPTYTNQFSAELHLKKGESGSIKIVLSSGTYKDFSYVDVGDVYARFDEVKKSASEYIKNLPTPPSCNTEFLKAYYNNLYNCSLSMYKEMGKFKGFLAGIVYQSPARTYYRDGYWTILSVLPNRPELVRNEIITLATGVDRDGKCPSAVKYNFTNWWGNHYDSPSFLAIMLYDYVRKTGDRSLLFEKWRRSNILDCARMVVEKLAECVDETGLLYKGGEYNRRDWCDNVFRMGYCTYDEALFQRALYALGELYKGIDDALSSNYYARAEKVKKAINDLLWDSKRGYYVNYKDENFTEDNLSIDTVVCVLFGIADKEKAISTLKNMEQLLESKNNSEQKAGDFGCLSVYPFYKDNKSVVIKSSLPYYYHNGGDWPYWSAAYAYAKLMYGMDYEYPLTRWFTYNLEKKNFTPMEFYSPCHPDGSLLQAWSSLGAFVLSYADGKFFD
ncbi:MAG: hypothetical protein J6V69_02095 [Clostridia bacterium]|nr:hypothetical protein [Clostridia bacterium]